MYATFEKGQLQNLCKGENERKELEELIKTEEIYQMGRVLHEIGNSLALVYSRIQLLEKSNPDVSHARDWSILQQDMKELNKLFREMSAYNQSEQLNISKIDLLDLTEDVLEECNAKARQERVELVLDEENTYLPGVTDYLGDVGKLRQALINLVKNAIEEAGKIAKKEGKKEKINIRVEGLSEENKNAGIAVVNRKENEQNLSEEIFQLYYTTKKNGSGLGLPISKKIIEAHGGTLEVNNQGGQVEFCIVL